MEYQFRDIEKKWQQHWKETHAYRVSNDSDRPKCYVMDMFPYPSGAGLHVGHPLGYIASDIYSRYKRLKGFNVLHPMGYDAFGLPAEQYAIEHGIHPAISTANNIDNFRKQLDNIGFSFDWSREIRTSDPGYYKWTQWIFLKLFNSWFNRQSGKAEPISGLISIFEKEGNIHHPLPLAAGQDLQPDASAKPDFNAADWKEYQPATKESILMQYRLAYCGVGEVNWCEALGTVLANDEVVNGVSERGGFPVERKKLRQWYLRITEYADRLLEGLERVEFSEAMKEMQTNWIGKSSGAEIEFRLTPNSSPALRVYTTRPDTIFGVDFMVIAPEHELVNQITTAEQQQAVEKYLEYVNSRSERERMAEKKITGVFTGAYAIHPFDPNRTIPVWISEYVLAGYGTGAIMAVPCGDQRDFLFAKHFNIPITNIIGPDFNGTEANPTREAILENSAFLDGMIMKKAIDVVILKLESTGIGKRKVNYKMRDAAFSRQRYWGEPIPVKWAGQTAFPLLESTLPLELPQVETYKPGPEGEGPLANIKEWIQQDVQLADPEAFAALINGGAADRGLESSTMPGYAGSSWYFLRYMDPFNERVFCDRRASDYWGQVDLYVGGTEHAVGHLLYSRMWTKVLFDLGLIGFDEPYKKLLNQGMIQGSSRFVFRKQGTNTFISAGLREKYDTHPIHVDVNMVDGLELDMETFRNWRSGEYADAEFILENGKYICGMETEKMSKSKFNTVNPNDIVARYGADTFRMYEMFLGPVEMSKPWDTKGIEGVYRFLKKLWRLFFDEVKGSVWNDEAATEAELKILHRTIRKIEEDTERFSFNTAVSAFMICVNELTDLKCHKKQVLEPLIILLTPFAPHISEELWNNMGNASSVLDQSFPRWEEKYIRETSKAYPIAINGKTRTELTLALDATQQQVEELVLQDQVVQKWLEGKTPKKIIYVKNKMINVVV
jgi:leucyl-tRNA synthetase